MEFSFILKGLILGLSVAAPVGPIGLLCINRTINKKFSSGLLSGLGAASADMVYGAVAGLGLTVVSGFLLKYSPIIQALGCLFLFYLSIKTFRKKPVAFQQTAATHTSLWKDYLSTFLLTLTNPATILFFIAAYSGLGLVNSEKTALSALFIISSVFIGSALWWLLLSGTANLLGNKIQKKYLPLINKLSGTVMGGFALFLLIALINDLSHG